MRAPGASGEAADDGYQHHRLTNRPASAAEVIAVDGPNLLEAILPGLIAALIQWWIVRRHLRKVRRLAPAN